MKRPTLDPMIWRPDRAARLDKYRAETALRSAFRGGFTAMVFLTAEKAKTKKTALTCTEASQRC